MKDKDWITEREYQDRLESLLKDALNTQLRPLMSLETATKKRRAQKNRARLITFRRPRSKHNGSRPSNCFQ